MNYWMVKFESYTGQGNAAAWFETKKAAQKVYDDAVKTLSAAQDFYMSICKRATNRKVGARRRQLLRELREKR